jgi:hypothetical protein
MRLETIPRPIRDKLSVLKDHAEEMRANQQQPFRANEGFDP